MSNIYNNYGPTAARRHGTPGKKSRPTSLTFDIHSHVAVPAAAKFATPHLDPATVPLLHFSNDETRAINKLQEQDRASRISQYDERLIDMDEAGLDMQLIMSPPNQCYSTVPAEIGVQAARIVNEGLAEYV
ncbi:MAG TPA: hypothetical protein VL574_01580, partial [Stellaceae bacterium]|nr:hypothetical protein [Stellaceae bacterium]